MDTVLMRFNRTIMDTLRENRVTTEVETVSWGNAERWRRLLDGNDLKKIWKSIGWNGSIEDAKVDVPSDEDFRIHFEHLLNPPTPRLKNL